jgi:uncharacterized damage-inducible protein DinB
VSSEQNAQQYANRVAAGLSSIAQVPQERRTEPGMVGHWSLKDVLGHLAYWDGVHVDELVSEFRGDPIVEDNREDDVINAEQFAIRQTWSWDKVMDEAIANRDRLIDLLKRPSRYDQSGSGEHWDEHRREIEAWLMRNQPIATADRPNG